MKLKRIRCMLSIALVLSSFSVNAYANINEDPNYGISLTGIIGDSVIIDKGESNGGSTLLPEDALDDLDNIKPDQGVTDKPTDDIISSWGDREELENNGSTQSISKKGSIKITLPDIGGKNDKSNVKFSISKVADIIGGEYKLTDSYKSSGVDLNSLKNSNDLEIAANMLKKTATTDLTLVTDGNGACGVKDLDVGVYLVYATDIANYENITPFIISIPVWNEADKTMSFDVEVIPKHTPLPVKKPEISKAPSTGYSGGELFGVLSGISLIAGTGILKLRKEEEE